MDTPSDHRTILTCTACGAVHGFSSFVFPETMRGQQGCLRCGKILISWRGQTIFHGFAIEPPSPLRNDPFAGGLSDTG
jgi:hypothetical protein